MHVHSSSPEKSWFAVHPHFTFGAVLTIGIAVFVWSLTMRPILGTNLPPWSCSADGLSARLTACVLLYAVLVGLWWHKRAQEDPATLVRRFFRWITIVAALLLIVKAWFAPSIGPGLWTACVGLLGVCTVVVMDVPTSSTPTSKVVWSQVLAPVWCGAAVAALIFATLIASGFTAVPYESTPYFEHLRLLRGYVESSDLGGEHAGAQVLVSTFVALTIVSAGVAAWNTVNMWWATESQVFARRVTVRFAGASVVVASAVTAFGLFVPGSGIGSAFGNTLLCGLWKRNATPGLAMAFDTNNVIGVFVPTVIALGMCLLLEPMNRSTLYRERLQLLARRTRSLETMLYVGAISLVLGVLQTSALFNFALAPLPSLPQSKVIADLCRQPNALASGAASSSTGQQVICDHVVVDVAKAAAADAARQFARSTTLAFGIAFSALLAALYVPAALVLRASTSRELAQVQPIVSRRLGAETGSADRSILDQLGKLVATLSPLFAGLLSNALSV